jgi:hypothetical protein
MQHPLSRRQRERCLIHSRVQSAHILRDGFSARINVAWIGDEMGDARE